MTGRVIAIVVLVVTTINLTGHAIESAGPGIVLLQTLPALVAIAMLAAEDQP